MTKNIFISDSAVPNEISEERARELFGDAPFQVLSNTQFTFVAFYLVGTEVLAADVSDAEGDYPATWDPTSGEWDLL